MDIFDFDNEKITKGSCEVTLNKATIGLNRIEFSFSTPSWSITNDFSFKNAKIKVYIDLLTDSIKFMSI